MSRTMRSPTANKPSVAAIVLQLLFVFAITHNAGPMMVHAHNTEVSLEKPFQKSFSALQHSPCVSLYTRNGRFGCGTADRTEQSGKLVHFANSNALQAGTPKHEFVALIPQDQLQKEFIKELREADQKGYLQGILVLNTTFSSENSPYYSAAPSAPQGLRTPSQLLNYGNSYYSWNSIGDGLMEKNLYGVPTALVNDADVGKYLLDAVRRSDNGDDAADSDIVASFDYYMGPDEMDSFQCLAWRDVGDGQWRPKCQPLTGNSVWATAGGLQQQERRRRRQQRQLEDANADASKEVFVVGTAIDAASMFYGAAPGASTGASNTLALLMAAKLFGAYVDDDTVAALSKDVVLGFFQAEAFGFLGSRAFLQDVAGFECQDGLEVPSVASDNTSAPACLYPATQPRLPRTRGCHRDACGRSGRCAHQQPESLCSSRPKRPWSVLVRSPTGVSIKRIHCFGRPACSR